MYTCTCYVRDLNTCVGSEIESNGSGSLNILYTYKLFVEYGHFLGIEKHREASSMLNLDKEPVSRGSILFRNACSHQCKKNILGSFHRHRSLYNGIFHTNGLRTVK
jgi:hypothetical protein